MMVAAHAWMRQVRQAFSRTSPVLKSSGNHGMTMTRRKFLSASAALAAAPALGADAWGAPLPREADIVVIGAGAAGIAAARRIKAANPRATLLPPPLPLRARSPTATPPFPLPF